MILSFGNALRSSTVRDSTISGVIVSISMFISVRLGILHEISGKNSEYHDSVSSLCRICNLKLVISECAKSMQLRKSLSNIRLRRFGNISELAGRVLAMSEKMVWLNRTMGLIFIKGPMC